MWQTSMRYGAQINDNKEQSTLLRATLLCQRLQTSAHHRSNDNIDVIYDDSMLSLNYTLHFEYFLEIRFIEYKLFTQGLCTSMLCRWVLSTIATSKAPWDKIDAQVKSRWLITQVYNGQLTHVTESLTHRELQRDLFFSIAHSAMQFGKRHVTYDAEWQQNDPSSNVSWPPWMNQTTFQLCMPGGLNLDIHILILINIYII